MIYSGFFIFSSILLGIIGIPDLSVMSMVLGLITSIFNPKLFVFNVMFSTSLYGIHQFNSISNIAQFSDILISILVIAFVIIHHSKIKFYLYINSRFFIYFSCFFIIFIVSFLFNSLDYDLTYFLSGIKDFALPLFCFYPFYLVLSNAENREDLFISGAKGFIFGIIVVAFFSLINYFYAISTTYNSFVLLSPDANPDAVAERSIGFINFARMQSVFGLSTQGAAGVMYAVALVFSGFYLKRFFAICSIMVLTLAGVLSMSFSFIVSLGIYVLIFVLNANENRNNPIRVILQALLLVFFLFSFVFEFNVDNGTRTLNLYSYAYEGFIEPASKYFDLFNFHSLVLGFGTMSKYYWNNLDSSDFKEFMFRVVYDNWLFAVLLQIGLLAFVVLLMIIFRTFFVAISKTVNTDRCAAIGILMFIGFAHGAFIIDKLFLIKSMFFIAYISSREKYDIVNNHNLL